MAIRLRFLSLEKVNWPAHCCNCFSSDTLSVKPMELTARFDYVVVGVIKKLVVALPFCASCRDTANRLPLNSSLVFMGAFTIPVLLIQFFVAPQLNPLISIAIALAFAGLTLYGLQKRFGPRGSQATGSQPVALREIKSRKTYGPDGQPRNEIEYADLAFHNVDFAKKVVALNPNVISHVLK